MKNFILILFLFSSIQIFGQHKPAYTLFDASGKKVSYNKMIRRIIKKDIVLIGEYHNNPISHWMELEISRDCKKHRNLVLGAEMFEQDNQPAVDLYLQDKINVKELDSMARLWKNFSTDYAPLLNFAKDNKIAFIGTNVPRRFASMVSKGGFESLNNITDSAKAWMAPLPIAYDSSLPGYTRMMTMMKDHGTANMPKAQALKDASMAHFILKNRVPGYLFIHYNGAFHSEYHDGIVWYLKQSNPKLKMITVTTVSQKNVKQLEVANKNKADFIICVDEDMTTTY